MNIDTLSIARDLRAAELPSEQAEAIAAAIGRAMVDGAAAKGDVIALIERVDSFDARLSARLDRLESQLGAKVELLDAQITSRIEAARASLLTWLVGVILATAGAIVAVVKL